MSQVREDEEESVDNLLNEGKLGLGGDSYAMKKISCSFFYFVSVSSVTINVLSN